MNKLKRCPFCNSKKVAMSTATENGFNAAYVVCFDCGARTRSFDNYDRTNAECKTLAKEAWNRRDGV